VSGQETLCLAHRLEPPHLSLSPSGRPMRVLCSVVQVAALSMLDVREQFTLCHAVALQLVCDQDPRRILEAFQETLDEALRRSAIATTLYQDVQHDAVLVDGAPEISQSP
jgi:hypothetical protein